MTYPPAPWILKGYAFQTLHLVDIENCRSFIASDLEIVSVFPGKTLGGVYFSAYQSGSILEYNELIVVCGLVRYQEKIGAWLSHIYVDNKDSVAGGREIWGLPKEMAEFTWDNNGVSVSQSNHQLCHFRHQKGLLNLSTWWQQQLSGNVFGGLNTDLLFFTGTFKSYIGLVEGQLEVPTDSRLAELKLSKPLLNCQLTQLTLTANPPTVIGKKSIIKNIY